MLYIIYYTYNILIILYNICYISYIILYIVNQYSFLPDHPGKKIYINPAILAIV